MEGHPDGRKYCRCATVICAGSCSLPGLHNNLLRRCAGSPSDTVKKFAKDTKLGQIARTDHEKQLCRSVQISYRPGPPLEAWHSMLRNAWSCTLKQEISSTPKSLIEKSCDRYMFVALPALCPATYPVCHGGI
jgi:hypothetical protein